MTTALKIIEQALGELGVKAIGQAVAQDDLLECFDRLNALLDSWRGQGLYATATETVTGTLLAGASVVNMGPFSTFDISTPFELQPGCFYRMGEIDYPIHVATHAEYQAIPFKASPGSGPSMVYQSLTQPVATLYFWPVPTEAREVTLSVSSRLNEFTNLNQDVALAPGYQRALFLTLAEELAAPYQIDISPLTVRNATVARRLVRRVNVEIPKMQLDPTLLHHGGYYTSGGVL